MAGLPDRDGDELEHQAVAVGPDGKEALLAVVLDEPGGIPPGVFDVRVLNAVLASRWQDLRSSSVS